MGSRQHLEESSNVCDKIPLPPKSSPNSALRRLYKILHSPKHPPEDSLAEKNTRDNQNASTPAATRVVIHSRPYQKSSSSGNGFALDFVMVIWKEHDNFLFSRHDEEVYRIDRLVGTPIPANHLRPCWHPGLPIVSRPVPEEMHVKKVNLVFYMGSDALAVWLLAEAEVLAQLELKPHPNIARFHGCLLSGDGRIVGLCTQRYPQTLEEAIASDSLHSKDPVRTPSEELDRSSILQGIVAGVKYLHTLGFVHNDLNPMNIMLDNAGVRKLIDFDASKPVGASMKGSKVFTRPWGRRNPENIAMFENDYLSLGLIALYLKGQFPPPNRTLEADQIEPAINLGKALLTANSDG